MAVVVARDRYAAADALEADRGRLRAAARRCSTWRTALDEALAQVHDDQGNKCLRLGRSPHGDLDAAFRDAPVVIERRYRPAAADPDRDGAARGGLLRRAAASSPLWSATQIPHILRVMLAAGHRHPRAQASGSSRPTSAAASAPSSRCTAEEVLAPAVARRLGRPVKWTESRSEGNMTVHHGRDQIQRHRARGRPRRPDPRPEGGPARRHGRLPDAGHAGRPAARRVHVQRRSTRWTPTGSAAPGVFTTKTPTDAYRGAGRPEATFAIERMMDELAAELGMDPMELRRAELDQARGVPVHHRSPA